ncbi:MAG: nucleotide-binding universal stress UspA family protein [Desulforhopalus sp.]
MASGENERRGSKMKETDKIIVPVDFSEATESLVKYAVYMAGKLSAPIHFIHVINILQFVNFYTGDPLLDVPYVDDCEEFLLTKAKEKISNLIKDNSESCAGCTGEVVTGDPVEKIVEVGAEKDANLIIISTHGFRGLKKIMLGSVAGRVLKRAHCPVLIMNPYKNQH